MEHEIIFRGKRLYNGEWVEGHLLSFKAGQINPNRSFILPFAIIVSFSLGTYTFGGFVEVDPATVGQYTEMDGENLPIFEGDIVEFFGIRGVVVRAKGAFGIQVSDLIDYDILESEIPYNNSIDCCFNDNFISLWELWWNFEQDDEPLSIVKVLGNIYDNPELLEERK